MEETNQRGMARRSAILRRCARIMPVAAQGIMLVILMANRQWVFALMVGAGCVGTAAALASGRDRPSHPFGMSQSEPPSPAGSQARLASSSLEDLLDLTADSLPFRTIAHRWLTAGGSCSVPIGLGQSGATACLDLAQQGPHAMVAGTTGSGKSILLQDWCLALAATLPPWRMQFVLLDFKGGAALDSLAALPHVRGCVNDLDLPYATRALLALERELTHRERLAASLRCPDLMESAQAPPRLVIVVDEFHMVHEQLPDYMDRLVRIASLGRSLGMHLIACTQNPLGQISASMKANINCRICLRVRDGLQSQEMIGSQEAARLPAAAPGLAFVLHDEQPVLMRCARPRDLEATIAHIETCHILFGRERDGLLFTPPLPCSVDTVSLGPPPRGCLPLGLSDDGVAYDPAWIDSSMGNLALIGSRTHGVHEVLQALDEQAHRAGLDVACVADADRLLDPLAMDAEAIAFRDRLADHRAWTIFTLQSGRRLRVPEHCAMRLVFPTGDRSVDLGNGIPARVLAALSSEDYRIPGRGILLNGDQASPLQCIRQGPDGVPGPERWESAQNP
ncbi:FtsK/SpoIIIE domain-containing protein [Bifidobacterium cuniculi]|uniref:DNA segregation ATPase n=1 Tax=Bifidobacterium cuniculi TaxID=1688 RepID=A0A087B458_9BIFI|nr:FtsK/SpoIIIE domain-containing protein [Bifidobacterium cuniculi]KFI65808.1 DNA segregation ATPase [Bifidobacterium cuniculi]